MAGNWSNIIFKTSGASKSLEFAVPIFFESWSNSWFQPSHMVGAAEQLPGSTSAWVNDTNIGTAARCVVYISTTGASGSVAGRESREPGGFGDHTGCGMREKGR